MRQRDARLITTLKLQAMIIICSICIQKSYIRKNDIMP